VHNSLRAISDAIERMSSLPSPIWREIFCVHFRRLSATTLSDRDTWKTFGARLQARGVNVIGI
jgi:hypothetical protein